MKIANSFKLANVKALFTKAAIVGLFAGAAFMAAPAKANAQVAVGIRFGGPVYRRPFRPGPVRVYTPYYAPGYYGPAYAYGPGYYGYDRHLAWERRERDHRFYR